MNVRVESVSDEVVALGPSTIGFRVVFGTDALRGQAWFVSVGGSEPPHCGSYAVETGMRELRRLQVASHTPATELGVAALPEAGDYRVRGTVESAWPQGEACGGAYIRAGRWTFMLSVDDCVPEDQVTFGRLATGDEVDFEAAGLSLWDENL
jgi:hypothetical protein